MRERPCLSFKVQERVIRFSTVYRARGVEVAEPVEEGVGGQVGEESEPADVDAQDGGRPVVHASGGAARCRCCVEEDQGDVGSSRPREVRVAGEVEPVWRGRYPVHADTYQAVTLRSTTSSAWCRCRSRGHPQRWRQGALAVSAGLGIVFRGHAGPSLSGSGRESSVRHERRRGSVVGRGFSLIANDDRRVCAGPGNGQVPLGEKFQVFLHSPTGLIQTIFNRVADAGKPFQVRRVGTEEVRLVGRFNDQGVRQVKHDSWTFTFYLFEAGGFEDRLTGAVWDLFLAMIVNPDETFSNLSPVS